MDTLRSLEVSPGRATSARHGERSVARAGLISPSAGAHGRPGGTSHVSSVAAFARDASWRDRPDDSAFGSFRYHPSLDGVGASPSSPSSCSTPTRRSAPGGLLGVSVFFTLSGFLITRLLLDEGTRSAALDLPAFWARRLRRLLPAALAGIAFVLVLAGLSALPVDPGALQGDVLGALGYSRELALPARRRLVRQPLPGAVAAAPLLEPRDRGAVLPVPPARWSGRCCVARRARTRSGPGCGGSCSSARALDRGVVVAGSMGNVDFVYYSLPSRAGELLDRWRARGDVRDGGPPRRSATHRLAHGRRVRRAGRCRRALRDAGRRSTAGSARAG